MVLLLFSGSGKIQDLQFRSQWFMISQKGINGFTSLEKLTFAKNDRWGEAIDERICVPRQSKSFILFLHYNVPKESFNHNLSPKC